MCNISLDNQYASTYEYSEDCNSNEGVLHLVEGADDGEQTTFAMSGSDTIGDQISGTIDVPNSEKVNPTKVFWYIAKAAKALLCPDC